MKQFCGAKLRGKDRTCRKSSMANGRCRLHGGATPNGPDSANFKHGRYADAFKGLLAAKFKLASEDANPFDLLPELATQRSVLDLYVENVSTKKRITTAQVKSISDLAADVVKTATMITKSRSENALTIAEIKFVVKGITFLMEKYVPDPDRRRNFIADLRALLPERVGTEADEPSTISIGAGTPS